MKFFVPATRSSDEANKVYDGIKKFIGEEQGADMNGVSDLFVGCTTVSSVWPRSASQLRSTMKLYWPSSTSLAGTSITSVL